MTYDKKATTPPFTVGDKVLLYHPHLKTGALRKLALPNKGPYVITRISSTNAYIRLDSNMRGKEICVAWERLRPCPPNFCTVSEEDAEKEEHASTWKERLRPRVRLLIATRTSMQGGGRCNGPASQETISQPPDHKTPGNISLTTRAANRRWPRNTNLYFKVL